MAMHDLLSLGLVLLISLTAEAQTPTYSKKYAGLTAVPNDIPITSVEVFLTGNQLTTLRSTDFSLFKQLEALHLNYNNISSISPDAFDNTSLELLQLSINPIKTVLFFPAIDASLRHLLMHHCQISNATWDQVVRYSNLNTLQLYDNQVTAVPNVTRSASTLRKLYLYNNKIETLDAAKLDGCNALEYLSLSGNGLKRVINGVLKLPAMQELILSENELSHFDMSNVQHMPQLKILNLTDNQLTRVENAYTYCRGASCTGLRIYLGSNPLPCDKYICWAKMNTGITVERDSCSGKPWTDVTVDDLPCPTQVLRLMDKEGLAGTFEKQELILSPNYKKSNLGQMVFMNCIDLCLRSDGCQFFRHGETAKTQGINHKDIKECYVWTLEP